jgi:hypothetical protein
VTVSVGGYSAIALMLLLLMSTLAVVMAVLTGFRKYHHDMPIAGSCSAAISAACHPMAKDGSAREGIVSRPLQWENFDAGLADKKGTDHLGFSVNPVGAPVEGVRGLGGDGGWVACACGCSHSTRVVCVYCMRLLAC